MHIRCCQSFQKRGPQPWEAVTPRELSEVDRRAIFSVCDCVIGGAGRTSVMMALRGSRSEKMRRLGLVDCRGHGHFAGMSEDEVLARIDTLIHEGLLEIEWKQEDMPLLVYTESGLEVAMDYAADDWLEELRTAVKRGAAGVRELSFLKNVQGRNQKTALLLADRVASEATAEWLPLLQAWSAAEIRRVRERLAPVIERLVRGG